MKKGKFEYGVDVANRWLIKGWIYIDKNHGRKVTVRIRVNGELFTTTIANIKRKDIQKEKNHLDGKCGFYVYIGDKVNFKDGDQLVIRAGDIILLKKKFKKQDLTVKPENNKILIVGLGKSGTSKLAYTVHSGMPENTKMFFEPKGSDGLQNLKQHREICETDSLVHKSLFNFGRDIRLDQISKMYDRKVWIIRDPRDRLISLLMYRWFKGHKPDPQKFNQVLALVKSKEENPSSINTYDIWHKIIAQKRFEKRQLEDYSIMDNVLKNLDNSWFILSYNDMIDEKFEELENYLGFKVDFKSDLPENLNRVKRSKSYGDWKNWFTKEDVDFFKPIYSPFIQSFFTNLPDWSINEKQEIDPEKASLYMTKLFTQKK